MSEQDEIAGIRNRLHELSEKLHAATVRVEVTATKLESKADQLDRIEVSLHNLATEKRTQNGRIEKSEGRLIALETRADEAKHQGAKYGGLAGGVLGLGGLLWQVLKGGQ